MLTPASMNCINAQDTDALEQLTDAIDEVRVAIESEGHTLFIVDAVPPPDEEGLNWLGVCDYDPTHA